MIATSPEISIQELHGEPPGPMLDFFLGRNVWDVSGDKKPIHDIEVIVILPQSRGGLFKTCELVRH